jgi:hypothetical protein
MRELGRCPRVYPSTEGFIVSLPNAGDDLLVIELRGGHIEARTLVRAERVGRPPDWIGTTPSRDMLVMQSDAAGARRMKRVARDGIETWLPGELPSGQVIRAEPGRLFVASLSFDAEVSTLYELACNL